MYSSGRFSLAAALGLTVLAYGCLAVDPNQGQPSDGDADADADADGGSHGDALVDGDPGGGDGGVTHECAEGARWVYLVGLHNELLRFVVDEDDPESVSTEVIGTLDCTDGASPFSMSVDRHAVAWVLHGDGTLFQVSTESASCVPTTMESGQHGLDVFGMGFVSDEAGSDREQLFVAGGPDDRVGEGRTTLARLDTGALVAEPIGELSGWPELTGTGSGELWAYFPDTEPQIVQQIDTTTGETVQTFELDPVLMSGTPASWAFAFWGGRFYVFLQRYVHDRWTHVYLFDPDDGSVRDIATLEGHLIVGAGVSTCAPYDLY